MHHENRSIAPIPLGAGRKVYAPPHLLRYGNVAKLTQTGSGSQTETAIFDPGIYYLTITAFNTAGIESFPARELVYYNPNNAPTITPIGDQLLAEDAPSNPITFTIFDLESPPSELTVRVHSSNPALIPDQNVLMQGSGSNRMAIILPQLNQSGSAQITLEVRDPQGASNAVTFAVQVVPLNDDPLISNIPDQIITQDTVSLRLPFYIFDAETVPDDLLVLPFSSNPLLIPDENIVVGGKGNGRWLTFRPARNMSGSAVIEVYVVDEEGGYSWTDFEVTVRHVNHPPTVSPVPNIVINEDTASPIIQLNIADVDSPPAALRLSVTCSNPSLIGHDGIILGGADGARTMVIRPKPNQFGTSSVQLVASDPDGASCTNSFLVTVNPVNDPPNIDPIPSFSIDEGAGPLTVPLTGINSGASNELQSLIVTAVSSQPDIIPTPQVNYASPSSVGSLLISPLPRTQGVAVITVFVSDGQATNSQLFAVSVQAINEPPVISALPDLAVLHLPTPLRLGFNVQDADTPLDWIMLAGYSSDPLVLPASNLVFSGTGSQRTLTIYPVLGRTGLVTVTILASDGDGLTSTSFYVLVSSIAAFQ